LCNTENEIPHFSVIPESYYYDGREMLSHNALFNFILGNRSVGKSFWFKDWMLNHEPDNLIIWIRRSKEDIDQTKSNWLIDLNNQNRLEPDREYVATKDGIYVDGILKIAFVALSTMAGRQSVVFEMFKDKTSTPDDKPYEAKKRIVFEEFIDPNGKYLKNEVELFLNLYVTIKRTSRVPVYFIGNKISFVNPYFEYFHIKPFDQEFKWFQNKSVLVQNYSNKGFEEYVRHDEFFNLVKDTKFGDYLVTPTIWKDTNAFIKTKPIESKQIWNIVINNSKFGIWYDGKDCYISWKTNENCPTFANVSARKEKDYLLDNSNFGAVKTISDYLTAGKMYFEDNVLKQKVLDICNGGWRN